MKHLERQEESNLPTARPIKKKISSVKLLLAALGLVVAAGFSMTTFFPPNSGDHLSETEKSQLVRNFGQLQELTLASVKTDEYARAINSMRLSPAAKRDLKRGVSDSTSTSTPAGKGHSSRLVWLSLWDFAASDGDVVHISSAGYEVDIAIRNEVTRIAIPVDSQNAIQIAGVHDGGGGITAALMSGPKQVPLPVLRVGEILTLPIN